jgi:hypothetical protein
MRTIARNSHTHTANCPTIRTHAASRHLIRVIRVIIRDRRGGPRAGGGLPPSLSHAHAHGQDVTGTAAGVARPPPLAKPRAGGAAKKSAPPPPAGPKTDSDKSGANKTTNGGKSSERQPNGGKPTPAKDKLNTNDHTNTASKDNPAGGVEAGRPLAASTQPAGEQAAAEANAKRVAEPQAPSLAPARAAAAARSGVSPVPDVPLSLIAALQQRVGEQQREREPEGEGEAGTGAGVGIEGGLEDEQFMEGLEETASARCVCVGDRESAMRARGHLRIYLRVCIQSPPSPPSPPSSSPSASRPHLQSLFS